MNSTHFTSRIDQWTRCRAAISRQRRRPLAPGSAAPDSAPRSRIGQFSGTRSEKIEAIRTAVASGSYDIESRLAALVERLQPDPPPRPAA